MLSTADQPPPRGERAYLKLLDRLRGVPATSVGATLAGGWVRVVAHRAGRVALVVERTSGDLELFWAGPLGAEEHWEYPVPARTTRRVCVAWLPPERKERTLGRLLEKATEAIFIEGPTTLAVGA